ncbi:MAG TPA: rRNA maturation RNase YbeY, partial [Polyangiaceae bacterium LLY-WYZ-14_1]|nr:rRNA maturation RNase YbeY [Polyangiaceae bacterium LLY-WYZ-14_1]
GDIVISVDTARRQAAEDDRPILGRVVFLLAHGLLHLLGYDHGTRPEERRMTAMTDVLVSAAGKPEGLGKKAGENPRGGVSGGAETRARGGRRRVKKVKSTSV